jgi:tRNA(fMet)-specific endonuclease VapC
MILLDTDILSLVLAGHPTAVARLRRADDDVGITVITKVEVLRGRYEFLLKASDGRELERAQSWLERTEIELRGWDIVRIDSAASAEFDRLRRLKTLKRIGRADLLIASIALGHRATLVSRNVRDFRLIPGLIVENWAG